MRDRARSLPVLLLGLALVGACSSSAERHAEAACAALRACDCRGGAAAPASPGGAPVLREDRLATDLDDRIARAHEAGLTVDEACIDWWIDHWPQLGCASVEWEVDPPIDPRVATVFERHRQRLGGDAAHGRG